MPTVRFLVSGRVQGVFFRASARAEAQRLGVSGSATNLADGRVEVIASGTDNALAQLEKWLQVGPPAARVTNVEREDLEDRMYSSFRID